MRGHRYAASVVASMLEHCREDALTLFKSINAETSALPYPDRVDRVIEQAISHYEEGYKGKLDILEILQAVAMFATPIGSSELASVLQLEHRSGDALFNELEKELDRLAQKRLLIQVLQRPGTKKNRYTAHTVLRRLLQHRIGHPPGLTAEPPLSVSIDTTADVDPTHPETEEGFELVNRRIGSLLSAVEDSIKDEDEIEPSRRLLRAAFGILRARWAAGGVARQDILPVLALPSGLQLPHLDHYEFHLTRLLDKTVDCSASTWLGPEDDSPYSEKGHLYGDELLWLYNELGQVAFLQGHLGDAYRFFRQQEDLAITTERNYYGLRRRQSDLNLAVVAIEHGKLQQAVFHLQRTLSPAPEWAGAPTITSASALGYLGLVEHLRGNLNEADQLYEMATARLSEIGNLRGRSLFARYRGDLARYQKDYARAEQHISESIAAAEAGRYPDLLYFARMTMAHLSSVDDKDRDSIAIEPLFDFARRVGLPKLEVDLFRVEGRFALASGDLNRASRAASRALALAVGHGMGLRATAGFVFVGEVERQKGNMAVAREIFSAAAQKAREQGYVLQQENAERLLLGTTPY